MTLISPDPPALPGTAPNKPVDCSDISSGLSCTNFAGVIFKPTGAALAARFIEIGEAVYSPGTVSLIVTNKNPDAYVSLEVDEFTGRTTYKNK